MVNKCREFWKVVLIYFRILMRKVDLCPKKILNTKLKFSSRNFCVMWKVIFCSTQIYFKWKKTRDSSRVFLYVENIVSDFRIFTRSLHTIICTAVKTCQENQKKTLKCLRGIFPLKKRNQNFLLALIPSSSITISKSFLHWVRISTVLK